jgi:AraC-like DNA-binding protein
LDKQDSDIPEVVEQVHARFLRFFPDIVEGLGGNPSLLMTRVGIDAKRYAAGTATYRQMVHLIELAAVELGCPDFGMRLAKRQSGGGVFGPLGLVMKNSNTFGDALRYVSEHTYAHSLAARVWLQRSSSDKSLFAGHDILLNRMPNKSQAMEQILLAGHLAAMEITGGRARVRRVHFRHQPVASLRIYRRYFGCELRFGQNEDGVVFSEHDLAAAIIGPDSQLYAKATSFIDAKFTRHRPPLDAQVRGIIMQSLGTARCRNERIAAELNLHPKTMQRLLKAQGSSFQTIKDEVRRDLMLYYLTQTTLDFARLSEKLGFTEQSVMTRYCNRWFLMPPTKLRSQGRVLAPTR